MNKSLLLLFVTALIQACSSSQTADQQAHGGIDDLYALNGCYDNLAASNAATPAKLYLSTIIWQQFTRLPHDEIAHVDINAISDKTIVATAIGHTGEILLKNDLRNGDEFVLENGSLNFTTYHDFSFAYPADYRFASAGCDAVTLGVDPVCRTAGSKGALAGAALMVWPDANQSQAAMRFVRNWASCEQYKYGVDPDRGLREVERRKQL
jgi:hypothetical protein